MFEYLNKLNDAQREAATHIDGPLLMIAGAGSGKTTTLINRVAYMVDLGIDPRNILMLTFTNAAAANMVEKAAALSNPECKHITACTFHSFCALVLRKHGEAIHLPKDFTIITPPEEVEAIKLVKSRLKYAEDKEIPKAQSIADVYSYVINFLCTYPHAMEKVVGFDYSLKKTLEVIEAYKAYKEENLMLTYDDLLLLTYKLLKNNKKREELEEQFRYVCVDEYQDTNKIQEQISFLLTKKYRNLAVVGDDYQSIYKFRGADVSNIIEFERRIPHVHRVLIDINYRSVDGILAVANEVMRENATFGFPKFMRGVKGNIATPKLLRPSSGEDEAASIVDSIEEWIASGKSPSEYAVLSRGSKETSLVEVLLTKKGIPFEKLGGLKFLEHQCVLDMLSFFKVYVNNSDELSWFHLLDIVPGVGEVYASAIVEGIKESGKEGISKWRTKRFYVNLLLLIDFVGKKQRLIGAQSLEELFDETRDVYFGLVEKKIALSKKDADKKAEMMEQMENDKETVEVLRDMAVKYSTVSEFLDSIVLDAAPSISDESKVVVSTIHSAKGLEWEHVDIMNCMAGMIPKGVIMPPWELKALSGELKDEIDEELRCLYVAITRAKSELTLYAPFGLHFAGKFYTELCPYLESSLYKRLFDARAAAEIHPSRQKVYLNVPYSSKEYAKSLGAKWDGGEKSWYVYEDNPNFDRLNSIFGAVKMRHSTYF